MAIIAICRLSALPRIVLPNVVYPEYIISGVFYQLTKAEGAPTTRFHLAAGAANSQFI